MALHDYSRASSPADSAGKKNTSRLGKRFVLLLGAVALLASIAGGAIGAGGLYMYLDRATGGLTERIETETERIIEKERVVEKEYEPQTSEEKKVITAVQNVSPAVVSVVATEQVREVSDPLGLFDGSGGSEVGEGSGFIVSPEGLVITNKHVVEKGDVEYTVFTKTGASYSARVLAKDPLQDLAILKIEQDQVVNGEGEVSQEGFPHVEFGATDNLQIGQTVIAIGNSLGEFQNTVSVGVISGLGRTITASTGGGGSETIENVIQTDAAINRGNSGGPLLNLKGEVIGINTAAVIGAQNIGFAIPGDRGQRNLKQVQETGEIVYPFLGVRYVIINDAVQREADLPVDYGALVGGLAPFRGPAVIADSAADRAGLQRGDIILEIDGEKVTSNNSLAIIIQRYTPEDTVELTIMRNGSIRRISVTLGEISSEET